MQRLEVSGAVRPIYGSLGVKRLMRGDNDDGDGKDSDNYGHERNNFLNKHVCNPLMCSFCSTNMWLSREKHDSFSPQTRCSR